MIVVSGKTENGTELFRCDVRHMINMFQLNGMAMPLPLYVQVVLSNGQSETAIMREDDTEVIDV